MKEHQEKRSYYLELVVAMCLGVMASSWADWRGPVDSNQVNLASLRPITSVHFEATNQPISMTGIVFDTSLGVIRDARWPDGFAVYDLRGQYLSLRASFGLVDGAYVEPERNQPSEYKITLDGKVIASGEVRNGEKPTEIALDVTGGRSLRIDLTNRVQMADPILTKVLAQRVGTTVKAPSSSLSPSLRAPANHSEITGPTVTLVWNPVPGADTYTVQIVQVRRTGRPSVPDIRMWAYTIERGKTAFTWKLEGIPSGEYLWSVLAFSGTGVRGVFSADWSFRVVR